MRISDWSSDVCSSDLLLLGIYALGSVAALGLAFAMVLEQAWLTVALSLLLPATAWIATRLELHSLRPVAVAVAAVVLARLVLTLHVIDSDRKSTRLNSSPYSAHLLSCSACN